MASTRIRVDIEWENGVQFEVTCKENSGDVLTVDKVEENGCIAALWPAVTDKVERYIKAVMTRVGNEMAKPSEE